MTNSHLICLVSLLDVVGLKRLKLIQHGALFVFVWQWAVQCRLWLQVKVCHLVLNVDDLSPTDQTEVDCSPGNENSEQHNLLEQLQSRYRQMEERITCPICIDNHIKLVFQCGHASCIDCSAALKTCPICRQTIRERIQLFVWASLSLSLCRLSALNDPKRTSEGVGEEWGWRWEGTGPSDSCLPVPLTYLSSTATFLLHFCFGQCRRGKRFHDQTRWLRHNRKGLRQSLFRRVIKVPHLFLSSLPPGLRLLQSVLFCCFTWMSVTHHPLWLSGLFCLQGCTESVPVFSPSSLSCELPLRSFVSVS